MLAVFYKEKNHHVLLTNSLHLQTPGPRGDPFIQQNQTPLTGTEIKDASLSFMELIWESEQQRNWGRIFSWSGNKKRFLMGTITASPVLGSVVGPVPNQHRWAHPRATHSCADTP